MKIKYTVICNRCGGTGTEPSNRTLTPEEMKTGRKEPDENNYQCIYCEGKGKIEVTKTGVENLLVQFDVLKTRVKTKGNIIELSHTAKN